MMALFLLEIIGANVAPKGDDIVTSWRKSSRPIASNANVALCGIQINDDVVPHLL